MRIIAGDLRGRRLLQVAGRTIRPTSDKVREAVFSILASRYHRTMASSTRVLDLYAGTGALGLEAISRGALQVTFVEVDGKAAATIRANLEHCGVVDRGVVRRQSVQAFLARAPVGASGRDFGLVFMDPPYDDGRGLAVTLATLAPPLLTPGAVIVVEHAAGEAPPEAAGLLTLVDRRVWGGTGMSFYRPETAASAS